MCSVVPHSVVLCDLYIVSCGCEGGCEEEG